MRAFLHTVAAYRHRASVRNVDQITRIPGRAVLNIAVGDIGRERARFDMMTMVLPYEGRLHHPQRLHRTDIDAVRASRFTAAIALEIAPLDDDGAVHVPSGEDTVLIIDEPAAFNREVSAFAAYAGAVVIGHLGAQERHPANDHVACTNHKQTFSGARWTGDDGAVSFDCQSANPLRPHCAVLIRARRNDDRVAGTHRGNDLA